MDHGDAGPLPFSEGIFSVDGEDGRARLIGSHCSHCRRHFFPRRHYCPSCLQPPETTTLPRRGSVYSYTVVRIRPPMGLPQPYSVGYVDLKEAGLRVFMLLDAARVDTLRIGLPVELRVGPLGSDEEGRPVLRPYFTPLEG